MTKQNKSSSITTAVRDFMKLESASGILLLAASSIAMLAANSPFAELYSALLDTTVAIQVGALSISKPLLLWINDGLMAVFFFLVGLEVKQKSWKESCHQFHKSSCPE
jgi:Na+:H+ antiporter, NhaA family